MSSFETSCLGHELFGSGPTPVVVLNDWMCDTSTWDAARPYLDRNRFTWAFVDLRGYGRSRERKGDYDLVEAAGDVLRVADTRGWKRFVVVGHSMSTLVALHLAQHHADRVSHAAVITPPPITGYGGGAALDNARGLALADDEVRGALLSQRWAGRLSPGFVAFKLARWRITSEPSAVAEYAAMFARDGLPDRTTRIEIPVFAITGEQDHEPMRMAPTMASLSALCSKLKGVALAESGHYPMQEAPPLLVAHLERFLS